MVYFQKNTLIASLSFLFFIIGYCFIVLMLCPYLLGTNSVLRGFFIALMTTSVISIILKKNTRRSALYIYAGIVLIGLMSSVSIGVFVGVKRLWYKTQYCPSHSHLFAKNIALRTKETKEYLKTLFYLARHPQLDPRLPSTKETLLTYTRLFIVGIFSKHPPLHAAFFGINITLFNYLSFLQLYRELFCYKDYLVAISNKNPFIIDCGNNIGMSVLFFKKLFPNATILGFEPDPTLFTILTKNVASNHLTNVSLINKALDSNNRVTYISDVHEDDLGVRIIKTPENEKAATKIETTKLSAYITKPVDLLKLDIEGSEWNVIHDLVANNKLHYLENIIIEIHKSGELEPLIALLKKHGFTCRVSTDVTLPLLYAKKQSQHDIIARIKQ